MGFFKQLKDILSGENCPACGTPGARRSGSEIRCLNPVCRNFNPSFAPSSAPPQPAEPPRQPSSGWSSSPGLTPAGSGPAPAGAVAIQYRNFQGQDKTFHAEKASLHRKQNHIIAKVAPKGQQVSLSRDRIQNLREVESQMQQRVEPGQEWPSKRERQVLGYHSKNKTTSPLYEKIRAKYPKW